MAPPNVRYTETSDGVPIAFHALGKGPAVAILFPYHVNHLNLNWHVPLHRAAFEYLARFFTIINLDFRGAGSSERSVSSLSLDMFAEDLRAVLACLQIELLSRPPASGYEFQPQNPFGGANPERLRGVLEMAAEMSNWRKRKKERGCGMGIEAFFCYMSYFAQVADVSVDAQNRITVHQIWAAGDVGSHVINPRAAENQALGGIIEGLSHMEQEITLAKGQVEQANFHQQPMLRMRQVPKIEVHFRKTDFPPTGLGEPMLPPVIPAVTNAVFAASGKRIRTLPLKPSGFAFA